MSKFLMKFLIVGATFGAAMAAEMAVTGAAHAESYPFCLKRDVGAGDCRYVTYQQCLAALSGRAGYCQMDTYYGQRRQ